MTPDTAAEHCAAQVKQHHPVRFVTGLFAPAIVRRRLFALYALDIELLRIPRNPAQPMIAAIRFQWWRDALEALPGTTRGHPILGELAGVIAAGIAAADLVTLIDEREGQGEPAITEVHVVTLAARLCGASAGENPIAMDVGVAIVTGDRGFLASARRQWKVVRRARKGELPAYLPATFVDVRHPVSAFRLHWRTLVMALRNRF